MSSSAPAWGPVTKTTARSHIGPSRSSTSPDALADGVGGQRVLGERGGDRHVDSDGLEDRVRHDGHRAQVDPAMGLDRCPGSANSISARTSDT